MVSAEMVFDPVRFKQYTHAKQAIAYEIRNLSEFLEKHLRERRAEECRQLMVKLAEDRFALAVVGQFKRGKSSLMNAIIGQDLLPTGVLPLTSAITVLRYGPKERLTIQREGAMYPEEVSITSLSEYVTEKGNPGNAKKVACAALEIPSQFLRRGLEFVDTPGIGSAIEANTATTYEFLPQSDAVIFVTSVDTPLTRAETDFLQSIREYVRKVFFVVNKIDLVKEGEREEILSFVSERLKREMGTSDVRIFPVSSAIALQGKLSGKEEQFEQSGMKALQEALSEFLSEEKSTVLLVSVLDKLLRLAAEAYQELSLLKTAGETSREEAEKKAAAMKERFQTLRKARVKSLGEVRERLIAWVKEKISAEVGGFLAESARALSDDFNEALSQSHWTFSFLVARDFAVQALPHFKQSLEKWTREETERLDPEIIEALRREWVKIEQELQEIPAIAADVLGGFGMEPSAKESTELPIHWVLVRPSFANIEWSPGVPLLQACLPAFLTKARLGSRLDRDIQGLTSECSERIESAFLKGAGEALDRLGSEIEKRAGEIESHIVQALRGKRLAKGIDGRWQIIDLDTAELSREIETLAGIERKLGWVRTQMLERESTGAETPLAGAAVQPTGLSLSHNPAQQLLDKPIEETTGSEDGLDLSHDLGTRGCPVCNRMIDAASRFFASRQYALATQEQAQRSHAEALGFCPLHTWQLEAMSSPQGLSQGFPSLMERLSANLSNLAATEDSKKDKVLALVQTSKGCRVCRLLRETERAYLSKFAAFVETPEGPKIYTHSQGLCLRHLGLLIDIIPSKEVVLFLIEHSARMFAQISEDMQNYALKRDALRSHTRNLDEEDAYLRGLVHSVGAKKVCFPWELDAEV